MVVAVKALAARLAGRSDGRVRELPQTLMSTILESLKKFGVEPPAMPSFTSDDLPYLIMATLAAGNHETTAGILIALAIRIEQLEERVFQLQFKGADNE